MITNESTRVRGVALFVVRAAEVPDSALAYVPDVRVRDYLRDYGAVGLARDTAGQWFALCSEGVGGAIPDPSAWLADVPAEITDLADFVRTFGARLESNFALWRERLALLRLVRADRAGYVIMSNGLPYGYGAACACGWHKDTGYGSAATAGRAVVTHQNRH